MPIQKAPRAIILGCAGEALSPDERRFFAAADPVGFILFRRNCRSPDQVRRLTSALREAVGREDAPILIDQEGGRVGRLGPPHWRVYPPAAALGCLPQADGELAARLGARLIADDLHQLGITVNCQPVLDVPVPGADPVIGDRAYSAEPARVARLGRAVCQGLLEGGVLPIIKHIPGHGRARVDSHRACPVIEAAKEELRRSDFAPFRALRDMPWAMTAHIVYMAIDQKAPATVSPLMISEVIRNEIGFDGVLVSDDLSMQALGGEIGERARAALAAGCDLALHCNGDLRQMKAVVAATGLISADTAARLARGVARRRNCATDGFDRGAAEAQFNELLAGARSASAQR